MMHTPMQRSPPHTHPNAPSPTPQPANGGHGSHGGEATTSISGGSPASGFLAPLARWVDVMERQLQV